jgi:AcrR family transcriptional regulator
LRADTRRTRDKLIAAAQQLLEEQGMSFALPDVARVSGVGTATVYRHFDSVQQLCVELHDQIVTALTNDLRELTLELTGNELLQAMSMRWIHGSEVWASAGRHVRSTEGFLQRTRDGVRYAVEHYDVLNGAIDKFVASGLIPELDRDYAVLMWITLYDERVFVDLRGLGWNSERMAVRLAADLLAVFRSAGTA